MDISSQVLVVDDDAETRRIISVLLQRIGLSCILVRDGPTALTLLDEGLVPSVIVLDLLMPVMDGFAVLAWIRSRPKLDKVPVLILSALADPETIRRGLDSGADAYVTKPYIAHSLVDRMRVLIAAGRQPQPQTRFFPRTSRLHPDPLEPQETGSVIEKPSESPVVAPKAAAETDEAH
jgi:two-component system alkaline phosphatase synthesis response regulator PhoP